MAQMNVSLMNMVFVLVRRMLKDPVAPLVKTSFLISVLKILMAAQVSNAKISHNTKKEIEKNNKISFFFMSYKATFNSVQ